VTLRRLLLLRHAKSSWSDAELADHDRPLSSRGRHAADAVRDHLEQLTTPAVLVLCSSAARTVETLQRIRPALPPDVAVEIEPALYGASADELLARLRRVPAAVRGTMLIGHNPGIEDLAALLTGDGDRAARAAMERKFPTAALAHLTIDQPWSALGAGIATLERFWTPRSPRFLRPPH
jgi:phosphohistidine phosphatase